MPFSRLKADSIAPATIPFAANSPGAITGADI
jgi:hypothetical protein